MSAMTLRGLRPADPVYDSARLEIDNQQPASRAERAGDIRVDCRRIPQVMVDDTAEERVAASIWQVRPRDPAFDHCDVGELRFCHRSSNIGETLGIDLSRVDVT
jgi:hypothetical protein